MVRELDRRVEELLKTVEIGEVHTGALAAVVDHVFTTLLPHAEAEEATLYATAARIGLEPLVDALTADHVLLHADARALRTDLSPVRAAAVARSLARLFESHARKENDLVVPALAGNPEVDLPAVLEAMGEHIEHGSSGTSETASERESDDMLDVRDDPPSLRHRRIFERFESLAEGRSFVLVNDHDPKPLFYQFQAERPDTFTWSYLEEGPEVWQVRIGRTARGIELPSIERSTP